MCSLKFFFKSLKKQKYKSPLILISSIKVLKFHMRKLKYKFKIKLIDYKNQLREAVAKSPLFDSVSHTKNLEDLFLRLLKN